MLTGFHMPSGTGTAANTPMRSVETAPERETLRDMARRVNVRAHQLNELVLVLRGSLTGQGAPAEQPSPEPVTHEDILRQTAGLLARATEVLEGIVAYIG